MAGVPVVTTPAGVEGLDLHGAVVTPASRFAATLTALLGDPARRSELGDRCRASAIAAHAPVVAAARRLAIWNFAHDGGPALRPAARTPLLHARGRQAPGDP